VIRGRVLYVDEEELWLARGTALFSSRDRGRSLSLEAQIPLHPWERVVGAFRLTRRMARAGVHHLLVGSAELAVVNRHIFRRGSGDGTFSRVERLNGLRPLSVATDGDLICYGEYRRNRARTPVHVWGSLDGGSTWQVLWRFLDVRHVHGVFFDAFTKSFWVTTGDEDTESWIWVTSDRFETLVRVIGGTQQSRAVSLCFTKDHVYYGSDTPLARNHIYRLARRTGNVERLQEVSSSVFFGCQVGEHLFFSTAAEPSRVNRCDRAEIWHSCNGERWRLLRWYMKDWWPIRVFQFGQIFFPSGPGDGQFLYFTPFATDGDQNTWILPVSDLS
jgi:hypothetical protein